jgi:hypothetical protein
MPDTKCAVHAHEDDLELYTHGRLERQCKSVVESHLLECQICRQRLSQCIGMQLNLHPTGQSKSQERDLRSELRFSTGDVAVLQELSPLSLDRQQINIVDVSRNGLGIVAPKALLPGTIVQVRINTNVELGEVRHCSATGENGYRIGLHLLPRI